MSVLYRSGCRQINSAHDIIIEAASSYRCLRLLTFGSSLVEDRLVAKPSIHLTKNGTPRKFWGGAPGRKCESKKNIPSRICKRCLKRYLPERMWQKFCSQQCLDLYHYYRKKYSMPERVKEWRMKASKRWRKKVRAGLCRACPREIMVGTKSWCERHWFQQAAWRNGVGGNGAWKKAKELLERQNYTCPYTGERLVIGKNASLDHKNPRSRFKDQVHLWENIEWVDLEVNRAKRALTKSEFIDLCRLIARRFPDK